MKEFEMPREGPWTGYDPTSCFTPPCFEPTRQAPWDDVYANMMKDIQKSDNPLAEYVQYLVWFNLFKQFSEAGLLYLASMKGDIAREVQHTEPEEETREEVRGNGQKSGGKSNSGHKERGDEGNF